ncbi:MAG: type II toxin-antitoxin system RelE/ParE family toxin [Thermodesulfobacteriota bacterium]
MKIWRIELKPASEKQYLKLDGKTRERVKTALKSLEKERDPLLQPNVRPLTGELKGDYRLRVGEWRVLFTPDREKKRIYVYAILPRGKAY